MNEALSTPLDRAFLAAAQDPLSGRVADALMAAPLWLLLESEPAADKFSPQLLALEAGPTALAFDTEDRLITFTQDVAAHVCLPGRALISMLAGQGLNLAINPGVAPSEIFWDAATISWAAEALSGEVEAEQAEPHALVSPEGITAEALELLGVKLAALAPALDEAWLAEASFPDGAARLLLVLRLARGAGPQVEADVARALADTGRLAGAALPELDAAFAADGDALLLRARKVGIGVELPAPPAPQVARVHEVPGSNPDKPPRLR
ncbi:MAG: hypothetical protein ACJAVR_002375 [Paracoccaceae bacterium]|jgi:hypothetical protein